MSIPVPILYKALKRVERSHKGGITVEDLAEYMDMLNPKPLIAELQERGYVFVSSSAIRTDTRLTIKSEGMRALLEYGLEVPEEEKHNSHISKTTKKRKRKHISWTWVFIALLLCVLCFFAGAYLAANSSALDWFLSAVRM